MLFPVFNKLYFILRPFGSIFPSVNSTAFSPSRGQFAGGALARCTRLSPHAAGRKQSPSQHLTTSTRLPPCLHGGKPRATVPRYQQARCRSGLNRTRQQGICWGSGDPRRNTPTGSVPIQVDMTRGNRHLGMSSNYCRFTSS